MCTYVQLMENGPPGDVDARFFNGTKLTLTRTPMLSSVLISDTGITSTFTHPYADHIPQDAPAEAQEIFHHVWKGLHRCEELEQHYNQLSWTADVPIFPLIVGKRSGRSSASGTHHSKVTNLSRGGLPMDHNQRLLRKDKIANSDTSDISHRNNGLSNGIHPDTATLSQFSEYSEVRPMKLQKRASSALSTGSHRSRSQGWFEEFQRQVLRIVSHFLIFYGIYLFVASVQSTFCYAYPQQRLGFGHTLG
eukprot:m.203319 g.203319  ORF g.203319 m.203319 type:complete len:249 (+) comp26001_c0_seq8:170-916(+)